MDTHRLQLGLWNDRHRLDPATSKAWASFPAQSTGYQGYTPAYDSNEMALVLRLLIERFGGEATSTALIKHTALANTSMRAGDSSAFLVGPILGKLADCGAITLEDLDKPEVIARIAPHGVDLAYQ